ncbi:DUF2064 domain-containing protein [Dehalobacter sp. DCM]|uniref:TIGR04282 family arsenosugar biosynthesis glycosyltransferase n=1 Tax=Dehalobacter sp. DCM TaxID=2907827 RepID=UPI00308130E1|nr:DUF2064 domain-containing protein [Dehalobacter sp. DCM]
MKKAIIVFTKVPKVGVVKTRLTEARGGILTPEEANTLYESCMLDVIDVALSLDNVDIWICYNNDGDRPYLDSILAQVSYPQKIAGVFSDNGGSFDDCMQYATDFLLKTGRADRLADGILLIGGDLPTLQPYILVDALNKLEKLSESEAGRKAAKTISTAPSTGAAIIEGSCQEGGFSIVGLTCTTPFDFHTVFYNMDGITALDVLVAKAENENIPLGMVEQVPDVDIPVDLASAMPVIRAIELAGKYDDTLMIPKRTIKFLNDVGLQSVTMPSVRETV